MKVKDKVIIVTGGGNGIGRELVLGLLERGATVAAVDINESALQSLENQAEEYVTNLSTHILDITDLEKVTALPEQIISRHGQIDGLINNAGVIQPFVGLDSLSLEAADKVIKINFYGTLYMLKTFLPFLIERPESHLINVSSMGAFFPVIGQSVYGASKAAVKLLTQGLQQDIKDTNCKVTVVIPGSVGTNIVENSGQKLNPELESMLKNFKVLSPEKAAEIILKGIEKNKPQILVGTDCKILYMLERLFPGLASKLFSKMLGSKLIEKP